MGQLIKHLCDNRNKRHCDENGNLNRSLHLIGKDLFLKNDIIVSVKNPCGNVSISSKHFAASQNWRASYLLKGNPAKRIIELPFE